jgi:hypothetical protein
LARFLEASSCTSPEGIPFACIIAPAISAVFRRNGVGICARRKQLDRGIQICEIRTNVAADFSAHEAECGNYMAVGHAPNLGADMIHFLRQLRHNTGNAAFWV